jgi:hypothetical protein
MAEPSAPGTPALVRRLQQLGDAVGAFESDRFALPPHIGGADAGGDAVARLAVQFERMSGRIAGQISALARLAQQRRELLTKVSHDLRTPTAAMLGYLELLLRHGRLDAAEQRIYLQAAARQSERLARLVGDLFQLAELDADDARLQGIRSGDVLPLLLARPDPEQVTATPRGIYLAAHVDGCVWSGRQLGARNFVVDHANPFSLWGNNDLWNLLPADRTVNGRKSDKSCQPRNYSRPASPSSWTAGASLARRCRRPSIGRRRICSGMTWARASPGKANFSRACARPSS